MARPHMGNKPQGNRSNFFTKNIQRSGENFLESMNAMDMQRGAIMLFRDLARGNVNIETYGVYMLDYQLLENCLIAANGRLTLHSINFTGVSMYATALSPNIPDNVTAILNYDKDCALAYEIIVRELNNLRNTGDLNHLIVMVNNLRNYRYNI